MNNYTFVQRIFGITSSTNQTNSTKMNADSGKNSATSVKSDIFTNPPHIPGTKVFQTSCQFTSVVLPFDWSEYRIYKAKMLRRRSTGSHVIRGLKRLKIKRFRCAKNQNKKLYSTCLFCSLPPFLRRPKNDCNKV